MPQGVDADPINERCLLERKPFGGGLTPDGWDAIGGHEQVPFGRGDWSDASCLPARQLATATCGTPLVGPIPKVVHFWGEPPGMSGDNRTRTAEA